MQILRYLTLTLALFISARIDAQQTQSPTEPSPTQSTAKQDKEASEVLLSKTVVQITTYLQGTGQPHAGTGFLVSVADSRLTAPTAFGYLVTNRHVAEAIFKDGENDCKKHSVSATVITMNLTN